METTWVAKVVHSCPGRGHGRAHSVVRRRPAGRLRLAPVCPAAATLPRTEWTSPASGSLAGEGRAKSARMSEPLGAVYPPRGRPFSPSTGRLLSAGPEPRRPSDADPRQARTVSRALGRLVALACATLLCTALLCAALARPAGAGTGARYGTSVGTWQWPLPGHPAVVRGFAPPTTPYGPGHRGVDLAGRPGMPVFAAGAGVIGYAGMLAGRGVVTVQHTGGLRTTYEPVLALVLSGQRVTAGQAVGALTAGHPGCRPAACLHWGLLRGETYLDPLSLLRVGRVRLLPLHAGPAGAAAVGAAGHLTATAARHLTATVGPATPTPALAPARRRSWRRDGAGIVAALATLTLLPIGLRRVVDRRQPAAPPPAAAAEANAGRPSSTAAGSRPWCASGRSGFP